MVYGQPLKRIETSNTKNIVLSNLKMMSDTNAYKNVKTVSI